MSQPSSHWPEQGEGLLDLNLGNELRLWIDGWMRHREGGLVGDHLWKLSPLEGSILVVKNGFCTQSPPGFKDHLGAFSPCPQPLH